MQNNLVLTPEQIAACQTWQRDPNRFFSEVLGCVPESYQREVNQTIADNERTAISACHDVGKTWDLARIVLWFGTCFPFSKIITTAPTFNQVKNILWSEIRAAYSRTLTPLGGKMNQTEWQLTPEGDWFALGFTPRNELSGEVGQGTQSSFQGFHAPYLLVLFDEATGIPPNIWTMVEGMMTSHHVKFVAIGNPTSRNSEFYRCFKSAAWAKVKLSCFNSPNLIANGIVQKSDLEREVSLVKTLTDNEAQERYRSYKVTKPYLITLKWVVQSILKWGMTHPLTVSKIFGEFPEEGDNTLIGLGAVEDSQRRVYFPLEFDRRIIGVDVARFGSDSTVLTAMHGKKVLTKKVFQKKDTVEVTGEIIAMSRSLWPEKGADIIVIDETGLGSGVVDNANEAVKLGALPKECDIRGVQFGAACEKEEDKERFGNLKARMFDLLSDAMKAEDGIMLLDEAIYLEELPTILYKFDSKGRKWIESKDEYKKRTGRGSPDHADSLALANFGRYDESSAGTFQKTTDSVGSFPPPLAASLGALKQWGIFIAAIAWKLWPVFQVDRWI